MQAARGTSVDPHDGTGSLDSHHRYLFAAVAVVGYLLDQASKALAVARLHEGGPDVQVVGDLLRLHLTRNPGAAFSTGTALTPLISVVAVAASLAVVWFARRLGNAGWAAALGFLLAGITGNLSDRLFRTPSTFHGHVVDFLRLPHWPIFNVADICINIAAALILVLAFRGIRLDGSRESDEPASVKGDDAEGAGS